MRGKALHSIYLLVVFYSIGGCQQVQYVGSEGKSVQTEDYLLTTYLRKASYEKEKDQLIINLTACNMPPSNQPCPGKNVWHQYILMRVQRISDGSTLSLQQQEATFSCDFDPFWKQEDKIKVLLEYEVDSLGMYIKKNKEHILEKIITYDFKLRIH